MSCMSNPCNEIEVMIKGGCSDPIIEIELAQGILQDCVH